jgi:glycosyltransferase involved in cell wall biosynthesis
MTSLEQYYVSAIIPVYNGEHFLARAINNILSQQHHPLEIIIIDDGSTDNTAKIAESYPNTIYYFQENTGPAAARNQGIKLAKGNVTAFLDVDDLWSDHKLAIQLQCLEENLDVEIVQGLIQKVKYLALKTGEILSSHFYEPYQHSLLGSSIYRSSVFEKVGLFDESMMYGEDVDWYIRAWENNIVKKVIPETTLFYHLHKGGMTCGKNIREKGLFHIYKRYLDRLRANSTLTNAPVKPSIKIGEYIGEDIMIKNYRLSNK